MALSKIQAESMNLADTYGFSGTVTGAGDVSNLVKLASVTTSGATSVDYNSSLITDTYMTYRIIGSNFRPVTNNKTAQILVSIDNGSNFNLGVRGGKLHQRLYEHQGYNYAYYGTENGSLTTTSVHDLANNVTSNTARLGVFDATFYNVRGSGLKYVNSNYTGELQNDADAYRWWGTSRINTTTKINFLRIKASGGNIAGTFTLYGIVA